MVFCELLESWRQAARLEADWAGGWGICLAEASALVLRGGSARGSAPPSARADSPASSPSTPALLHSPNPPSTRHRTCRRLLLGPRAPGPAPTCASPPQPATVVAGGALRQVAAAAVCCFTLKAYPASTRVSPPDVVPADLSRRSPSVSEAVHLPERATVPAGKHSLARELRS